MSEHLDEARRIASFAEDVAGSPDERSVPYLLSGILHALIAIAEGCTRAADHDGPCTLRPVDHVALTLDGSSHMEHTPVGMTSPMRWRPGRLKP